MTATALSDRRLAVIAAAGATISVAALVTRLTHTMPSGITAAVLVAGVGVALRVTLSFAARSATSTARARTMSLLSLAGLAVAAVSGVAALPTVTAAGGASRFVTDVFTHLWTLALLTLAAGPFRTLGWRAFAGALFAGFLGVSGLARLVGTPVVHALGPTSLFATAVYAPFTEELLKAALVVLIAVLAVRRRQVRPSALDLTLVGAWTGAGFALFEDGLYGRGSAGWSVNPPFSLLFPSEARAHIGSSSIVAGGHVVYTALVALGVAITVLYRHTLRFAAVAAPVACLVVLAEHVAVNAQSLLTRGGGEPLVYRILGPLTLGGRLSSILLVAGVVVTVVIERRAVRPAARLGTWLRLPAAESSRRMQLLAMRQTAPAGAGGVR